MCSGLGLRQAEGHGLCGSLMSLCFGSKADACLSMETGGMRDRIIDMEAAAGAYGEPREA